jgi:hypothetical protein
MIGSLTCGYVHLTGECTTGFRIGERPHPISGDYPDLRVRRPAAGARLPVSTWDFAAQGRP